MRMRSFTLFGTAAFFTCATGLAAQTVSLSLKSPESGDSVAPGTTIHWAIEFSVSTGDNAGLALLIVDLAQDPANPSSVDIAPAEGVPPAMANFSRPAGISNPGEIDPTTGYTGLQRGPVGGKDLRQIGGAQNTFGVSGPMGFGIAENAFVTTHVGQGSSVTHASGAFVAPAAAGVYVFRLENPMANVLSLGNTPPQFSPVESAVVEMAAGSIVFTVSDVPCETCDLNCDGERNGLDIQSFVDALTTSSSSGCSSCAGDFDASGDVALADIAPFLSCLLGA